MAGCQVLHVSIFWAPKRGYGKRGQPVVGLGRARHAPVKAFPLTGEQLELSLMSYSVTQRREFIGMKRVGLGYGMKRSDTIPGIVLRQHRHAHKVPAAHPQTAFWTC